MGQRIAKAVHAVAEAIEHRLLFAGLDPSWNGSGIQQQPFVIVHNEAPRAIAIQVAAAPGGKVVALTKNYSLLDNPTVFTYNLVRYNADGSVDTSFGGGDGILPITTGTPEQMLVRPGDGEILLTMGDNTSSWVEARTPAGAIDPGFSGDGKYTPAVPNGAVGGGVSIAFAPDSDLYVASSSTTNTGTPDEPVFTGHATIAKLNPDGSGDSNFSGDGVLTLELGPVQGPGIGVMAVQPDGHLVVAVGGNSFDRISSTGVVQTVPIPSLGHSLRYFGVQSDGKIVFADDVDLNLTDRKVELIRLNADLSQDMSYGNNGTATADLLGDVTVTPVSVKLLTIDDQDRAIIPIGQLDDTPTLLIRFTPDGDFDSTITGGGKSLHLDGIGAAQSVALQPDGKILLGTDLYGVARVSLVVQDVDLTAGVLTVQGTTGDDTITIATSGGNVVLTRNGAQTTYPAAQVQKLSVDALAGDDTVTITANLPATVNGRDGDDTITTAGGDDSIFGGLGADSINTGNGNDRVEGNEGDDKITAGDVTFANGSFGKHVLDGGDGNDTITAGVGADSILGGLGNDRITAGGQFDEIDAGDGDNFVSASYGATIQTFGGNDTIVCGDGFDNTAGGFSFDIRTGDGNDSITGGAGIEWVECGPGSDTINTAGGNDQITTTGNASQSPNTQVNAGDGDDLVNCQFVKTLDVGAGNDLVTVTNALTVLGGDGDDKITAMATVGQIDAGDGDDLVRANSDSTHGALILGGGGRDNIFTGDGNDSIYAGGGKDTVHAGSGPDLISGGGGNDLLFGQGGKDRLYGGRGNDRIEGQGGDDKLRGDAGADLIVGGSGTDAADRTDPLDALTEVERDL